MDETSSAPRIHPSGSQHRLVWGAQEATLVEVGGGLRNYRVNGAPVIHGYEEDELCPGAAGAVLAPWPNRIRGGRYSFGGRDYQLPLTEVERGNAIHGLVRWQAWTAQRHGPGEVVQSTVIHAQPGYPFTVALTVHWSLGLEGLTVEHTATNVGAEACPFGLATHPYLCVRGEQVDALLLELPATHLLEADDAGIPVSAKPLARTELDFRSQRRIGAARIDSAFTGLVRDATGRAQATVRGSREGGAVLWMDRSFGYVQVFTGDTLDTSRRRRAVAVEPMTCPADAFRSGDGLVVLAPGETWRGAWGISPL